MEQLGMQELDLVVFEMKFLQVNQRIKHVFLQESDPVVAKL